MNDEMNLLKELLSKVANEHAQTQAPSQKMLVTIIDGAAEVVQQCIMSREVVRGVRWCCENVFDSYGYTVEVCALDTIEELD